MRTLHLAYRVTDLAASVVFYTALGYGQIGRVDLGNGASLTMLKFPSDEFVALELVHRPADGPVDVGTGFSHHLLADEQEWFIELGEDDRATHYAREIETLPAPAPA